MRSRGTRCLPRPRESKSLHASDDSQRESLGLVFCVYPSYQLCHPERSKSFAKRTMRSRGTCCLLRSRESRSLHASDHSQRESLGLVFCVYPFYQLCHPERSKSFAKRAMRSRGTCCLLRSRESSPSMPPMIRKANHQ